MMKLDSAIGWSCLLLQLVIACGIGRALGQDAAGSQTLEASPPGITATQPAFEPLIGAGDLIKVSVFEAPEFDHEVRVSADGMISLPLIGEVHVAGLSPVQAQKLLENTLIDKGLMRLPQVSVMEKEYATQGVSVSGEVMKPGVYPLLGSRRLLDVISMAGGKTPKAGAEVFLTHRDLPVQPINITLSNDPSKLFFANVPVVPGDTIVVSKAGIVYVVGGVHKPGGFVMENGNNMTVLQAIALAEGYNPTASLDHARLIRKTPQGPPQEIPIDLNKILSSAAPDIKLEDDDIIYVPNSAAKSATHRALESILQVVTGMAIYHPF